MRERQTGHMWSLIDRSNNQLINNQLINDHHDEPRAVSYLLPSPRELPLRLVMTFREGEENFGKRREKKIKSPFF